MPDLLMVLLVFWGVQQPLRIGMGAAFVLGLCMDVSQSALLGQHALSYTVVSFGAVAVRRRCCGSACHRKPCNCCRCLRWVTPSRCCCAGPGGIFPGAVALLAPLLESLLWPLASWVLLAPQRRPPDNDQNRPL